MDGFLWYYEDESGIWRLLNVSSAPNYQYESRNRGSVLRLRFQNAVEYNAVEFMEAREAERIQPHNVRCDPSRYYV
jgi:hypothetical protein